MKNLFDETISMIKFKIENLNIKNSENNYPDKDDCKVIAIYISSDDFKTGSSAGLSIKKDISIEKLLFMLEITINSLVFKHHNEQ